MSNFTANESFQKNLILIIKSNYKLQITCEKLIFSDISYKFPLYKTRLLV